MYGKVSPNNFRKYLLKKDEPACRQEKIHDPKAGGWAAPPHRNEQSEMTRSLPTGQVLQTTATIDEQSTFNLKL